MDKYENYKDSGVEWLGRIPEYWEITHLKNLINYTTGNTPSTADDSYYETNGIYPWANISDLKNKTLVKTEKYLSKNGIDSKSMTIVPKNSLLFAFKLSVGNSSINKIPVYTNEAIAAFKENKNIDIKWLYYFMSNLFKNNAKKNIYGAPLLNRQLIENGIILKVKKQEQTAIANFLDKKTGVIDSAVEELVNQRKLLEELKQATIHKAVTKGLDYNVEMKDSGVEWIGKIPKDWKVVHLKNLINYTTGNTPSTTDDSYYETSGVYPWANISDLKGKVLYKTEKYLSKSGVDSKLMSMVPKNSLLFAFKLSVGNSSINKVPVYTNEAIAAFKENKNIDIKWLYYFMSTLFKNNAKKNIYGAHLLNRQLIENGIILKVNKEEQLKIADFLDDKTSKIDNSIKEIDSKISHLKEYKKTLINDAVTGKIKVYEGDV